jgi:hypothetical protein
MRLAISFHPRQLPWLATLGAMFALIGCGDGSGPGEVVPVKGKVNLGGQPVTAGTVTFTPDEGKGNTSPWTAMANIDKDGSYSLKTEKKVGAPPGWYKVSVNPFVPPPLDAPPGTPAPTPAPIARKYMDPNNSGLSYEVTDSPQPDAYDINLPK